MMEDIDFRHPRGLDRSLIRTLTSSQWVVQHHAILFTGPTGIGKSWLAQALAQKACRDGYTVWYRPLPKLFRELMVARADGSLGRVLETIARIDVLVVDDFAMAPLNEQERRDFLEICDDRYNRHSTILTSQLPWRSGIRRSVIPRWPTAFWTVWCTMLIGSNCPASLSARRKAGAPRRVGRELVHERSPVDAQTARRLVRGGTRSGPSHDAALRRSFQALPTPVPAGEPAHRTGSPQSNRVDALTGEGSGLDRSLPRGTVPKQNMRPRRRQCRSL